MRIWNRIRSGFGRGVEADLAEEMRLHRAMLEERFRAEGLSAREARERAAREFGPSANALEDSRAQWSFAWLESVYADIRYAVRALRRSKTFAATAVLTLGVGLALASVAFTLFNAYVLRPFAVTDPDSLYSVRWRGRERFSYIGMHSAQVFQEIRARRDVFSDVFATRGVYVMGATRHWTGVLVSGNYFRVLGARIALGRPIEEQDARTPGGDNVVVIAHAAWKAVFNLDPAVLGKKLVLRGQTYEVIGVTGLEFAGLGESPPDFWVPLSMHSAFRTEDVRLEVTGRLRPGVNKVQAEAALAVLAQRGREDGRADLESRSTVAAFNPMMIVFFSPVLLALGLVLATCCANVANMMLARGLSRQREIGVRLSVGAGRVRLVRQLLTEALAIAGLAGLLGVVLARLMLDGGQRVFFATVPPEFARLVRLHSLEVDYRVFLLRCRCGGRGCCRSGATAGAPIHTDGHGSGVARRVWRPIAFVALARCAGGRSGCGLRGAAGLWRVVVSPRGRISGAGSRDAVAGSGGLEHIDSPHRSNGIPADSARCGVRRGGCARTLVRPLGSHDGHSGRPCQCDRGRFQFCFTRVFPGVRNPIEEGTRVHGG